MAYWAHIGGFVAGLVLTFILRGMVGPRSGQRSISEQTLSRR